MIGAKSKKCFERKSIECPQGLRGRGVMSRSRLVFSGGISPRKAEKSWRDPGPACRTGITKNRGRNALAHIYSARYIVIY